MIRRLLISIGVVTWTLAAPVALAQVDASLPESIVRATRLTPPQIDQVAAHVAQRRDALRSQDVGARQGARDELLDPLLDRQVSRAFRFAYSAALAPALGSAVGDAEVGVALVSVQLAGALASDEGASVLDQALTDERHAVRYAAVAGIGEALEAFGDDRSVLRGEVVDQLLASLRTVIEEEESPLIISRAALSLAQPARGAEIHNRGLITLAQSMSNRLTAWRRDDNATEAAAETALRAISIVFSDILQQLGGQVNREFARAAGIVSGHTLTFVFDAQKRGDDSALMAELTTAAQRSLTLAAQALDIRDQVDIVDEANGRVRSQALLRWVGDGGVLTRPPFGEPSARFLDGVASR